MEPDERVTHDILEPMADTAVDEGPRAVPAALHSLVVGKALDRIADHAAISGSRLRYLLTGDPGHLLAEIR